MKNGFWKTSADDKKHAKLLSRQRVKVPPICCSKRHFQNVSLLKEITGGLILRFNRLLGPIELASVRFTKSKNNFLKVVISFCSVLRLWSLQAEFVRMIIFILSSDRSIHRRRSTGTSGRLSMQKTRVHLRHA